MEIMSVATLNNNTGVFNIKMNDSYESLISNHPLFSLLDRHSVLQLVSLLELVSVSQGDNIVHEGERIDCMYLIASGTAEVTRTLKFLEHQKVLSIALMSRGSIIGLSPVGFLSRTGRRTATVKALTAMRLLKINIYPFFQFLAQPQIKYPDLKKRCKQFLVSNFIHKLHLFDHLSRDQIYKIEQSVELSTISAGQLLYEVGTVAAACYFILKGQINVSIMNSEDVLEFHENQLIGTIGFIDKKIRKEMAQAETDTDLLILEYKFVEDFFKNKKPSLINKIMLMLSGKRYD
jgi:CRP-like cAMP-binding protein